MDLKRFFNEGDIVKTNKGVFEIFYNSDRAGFKVWDGFNPCRSFYLDCDVIIEEDIKVISTIYEDEDLLK